MEFLRQRIGLILKIAVSAAILSYLGNKLDWARLGQIARGADPVLVFAAALLLLPTFLLGAWRWQWLLRVQGIDLGFKSALQLSLIGQFFNAFLLGVTGGDVVKIYYAAKAVPEKRSAAGLSVLVDRIIGLMALLLIGAVLVAWQYPVLTGSHGTRLALVAFALAAGGGLVFCVVALTVPRWGSHPRVERLLERLPRTQTLQNLRDAAQRYAVVPGVLGRCMAVSLVLHLFNIAGNYVLARALGLQLDFVPFLGWQPVVIFLMAVPITFSGLGVREALVVMFLALFGVDREHALAFSFGWFGLGLAWSLIGGLVYLAYKTPADHPMEAAE